MQNELLIEIAQLKLRVERAEQDIVDIKANDLLFRKEVLDELKLIRSTLSEAKGGWRTLMKVGGAGLALTTILGSAGAWLLNHVNWK